MEENDLKDLLMSQRNRPLRRGWRCPNETQLAAYADCQLDSAAREFVEAHLADCDSCLGQVSFLVQSADWADVAEVPAQMLARARNLVPARPVRVTMWGWRWTAAVSTTACLVLIIAVILAVKLSKRESVSAPEVPLVAQQREPEIAPFPNTLPAPAAPGSAPAVRTTAPKPKPVRPTAPSLRNQERNGALPKLIFPRDGAVLRRGELAFRWQRISDALFYDVRVLTADGDLVFESKTEDTRLQPASDVPLPAGAKYFVLVRAHLRQGRTATSSIVSFRISRE